jgi:hypothetical protein
MGTAKVNLLFHNEEVACSANPAVKPMMMQPLIEFISLSPWMLAAPHPAGLPSSFPSLPEQPQPDQVAEFLQQLTQMAEQIECFVSESDLQAFVRWALAQSHSSYFTQDESLQLLELAWRAQKLLWAARSSWLIKLPA